MSTSSLNRTTTSVAGIGSPVLDEFGSLLVLLQNSSHPSSRSSLQYLSKSVHPDQNCLPEIENEYQRFQLWAANLGLRGQGHWSLDYRLRDATFVKDFVIDLLNELRQTITELSTIASGRRIPYDMSELDRSSRDRDNGDCDERASSGSDSDSSRSLFGENGYLRTLSRSQEPDLEPKRTEIKARTEVLVDIIDRLYKLAFKIRSPTTRRGPDVRDLYKHYPPEDKDAIIAENVALETRRVEALIIQARRDVGQTSQQITSEHTSGQAESNVLKIDEHLAKLISRLGKANAQRRAQFIYWRRQRIKIEKVSEQIPEMVQKPQPQRMMRLAGASRIPPVRSVVASSAPASASRLDPAKIDLNENRSTLSRVTRAPTAYGPAGEQVEWPTPADLPKGKEFECPYCFLVCPETYREKAVWRSHLIHDVRPYMCTYFDCPNATQLFDSWKDWIAHENFVHRRVWRCHDHDSEEFLSLDDFELHARKRHPGQVAAMTTPEALSTSQSSARALDRNCPFCDLPAGSLEQMQKHVAYHLETIALFALPRSTGLEKGSQPDDIASDVVRAERSDSRLSDSQLSGWHDSDCEEVHIGPSPAPGPRDSPITGEPSTGGTATHNYDVLFPVASVYDFNINRPRREAGFPYLTYVTGEIFDVIGERGELWLAKNQDDPQQQLGWIWNKHFARLDL